MARDWAKGTLSLPRSFFQGSKQQMEQWGNTDPSWKVCPSCVHCPHLWENFACKSSSFCMFLFILLHKHSRINLMTNKCWELNCLLFCTYCIYLCFFCIYLETQLSYWFFLKANPLSFRNLLQSKYLKISNNYLKCFYCFSKLTNVVIEEHLLRETRQN